MKKAILIILIISLVLSSIGCAKKDLENEIIPDEKQVTTEDNLLTLDIKAGDALDRMDLSGYDLRDKVEILFKVDFGTETIFPDKDKLPDNFIPNKIIEWGMNPGLNVKKLHNKGITGKGVNIAYVDQPLLINHEEYVNKSIHYEKIRESGNEEAFKKSMHGPGVTSILLGESLGVAPDVNLYYIANPSWIRDQITSAESVYRIIEINKILPEDEKIKIIGFSSCPVKTMVHYQEFIDAINEAEANGIMVFTVEDNFLSAKIDPYMDMDDYKNYRAADWVVKNFGTTSNFGISIFVPSTVTRAGYASNKSYGYDYEGGLSWVVPYVVGVSALGLQIDPTLTKEEILDCLLESAYENNGLKIINPEGFIELVISRQDKFISLDDILKDTKNVESINNLKKLIEEEKQAEKNFLLSIPSVESNNKDMLSYIDDGNTYADLEYSSALNDEGIEIESVGVAYEDNYINIKVKVILPKKDILTIFLQRDVPGLKVHDEGLKEGNNTIILKLDKDQLLRFEAGLGITLGDGNFIFIEKDLLDKIGRNNR